MPTNVRPPPPAQTNPLIDWMVPVAAVSLVFVMLVPLPAMVLDLLLATSVAASVLVLLSALQIFARRSSRFSPACCFYSRFSGCRSTLPPAAEFCCTAMKERVRPDV